MPDTGWIAGGKYGAMTCKYLHCNNIVRFLLEAGDDEYVVCGKHIAHGLADTLEVHELPVTVRAIPQLNSHPNVRRRQARG